MKAFFYYRGGLWCMRVRIADKYMRVYTHETVRGCISQAQARGEYPRAS